jgi:hypothetical protein
MVLGLVVDELPCGRGRKGDLVLLERDFEAVWLEQLAQGVALLPRKGRRGWGLLEDFRDCLAVQAHRPGDRPRRDPSGEQHASIRCEDTDHLVGGRPRVGREDRPEDRQNDVGTPVGQGNRGCFSHDEVSIETARGCLRRGHLEQSLSRIDARHARASLGGEQRGVPGSAADVHDPLGRTDRRAIHEHLGGRQQLRRDPLVASLAPFHRRGL